MEVLLNFSKTGGICQISSKFSPRWVFWGRETVSSTFLETKSDLIDVLSWGSLPKIFDYKTSQLKKKYLRTYIQTYLREEIQLEQLTRNLLAFRNFLAVAAQANGKIISYSKIAKASGVDEKSVARFFEILVDTLVGYMLEPYDKSVRKRQSGKPKFYLFDLGVARALSNQLDLPIVLVEIKSSEKVTVDDMKALKSFANDFPKAEKIILCREKRRRLVDDDVLVMPWFEGLKHIFRSR